jgi:hypothetical protein
VRNHWRDRGDHVRFVVDEVGDGEVGAVDRGPHFDTSQASSNNGTSRAIASNAPGTAGVRTIAAVSPEKNDVSPDPEDPSMITLPMSIPHLFMPPGSQRELFSRTRHMSTSYRLDEWLS